MVPYAAPRRKFIFWSILKAKGITINYISYDSNADVLLALNQDKVDAIAETEHFVRQDHETESREIQDYNTRLFNEWTGLAVRHGDPTWLQWVNTFLWLEHISGRVRQLHDEFDMPYIPVSPAYD